MDLAALRTGLGSTSNGELLAKVESSGQRDLAVPTMGSLMQALGGRRPAMILTFAVSGYRSLRELVIPLEQLTVITGPNGSGKSSLYKAIRLLADVAQGRAIGALALEGGLQSTLWAGPEAFSRAMKAGEVPVQGTRRRKSVSLKLGFADEDYGYAIDLGLPVTQGKTKFNQDPEIKAEALWVGEVLKRSTEIASRPPRRRGTSRRSLALERPGRSNRSFSSEGRRCITTWTSRAAGATSS